MFLLRAALAVFQCHNIHGVEGDVRTLERWRGQPQQGQPREQSWGKGRSAALSSLSHAVTGNALQCTRHWSGICWLCFQSRASKLGNSFISFLSALISARY